MKRLFKHSAIAINKLLSFDDLVVAELIPEPKTQNSITVEQVRAELRRRKDLGEKFVMLSGECAKFDPAKGCAGHKIHEDRMWRKAFEIGGAR